MDTNSGQSLLLSKPEVIYLCTLLGGEGIPGISWDPESEGAQIALDLSAARRNLEKRGLIDIGFDGVARVSTEVRQCVENMFSCDSYYLFTYSILDKQMESTYYCMKASQLCEMNVSGDGQSIEARLIYAKHEMASRIIERMADVLISSSDERCAWLARFELSEGKWMNTKQFCAGRSSQELWVAMQDEDPVELVQVSSSILLDQLDNWMVEAYV